MFIMTFCVGLIGVWLLLAGMALLIDWWSE